MSSRVNLKGISFDGEKLVVPDNRPRCFFEIHCEHAAEAFFCRKAKQSAFLLQHCPLRKWVTLGTSDAYDEAVAADKKNRACSGCCPHCHESKFHTHQASGMQVCSVCHPPPGGEA